MKINYTPRVYARQTACSAYRLARLPTCIVDFGVDCIGKRISSSFPQYIDVWVSCKFRRLSTSSKWPILFLQIILQLFYEYYSQIMACQLPPVRRVARHCEESYEVHDHKGRRTKRSSFQKCIYVHTWLDVTPGRNRPH